MQIKSLHRSSESLNSLPSELQDRCIENGSILSFKKSYVGDLGRADDVHTWKFSPNDTAGMIFLLEMFIDWREDTRDDDGIDTEAFDLLTLLDDFFFDN
jgi:hypothetical protein